MLKINNNDNILYYNNYYTIYIQAQVNNNSIFTNTTKNIVACVYFHFKT